MPATAQTGEIQIIPGRRPILIQTAEYVLKRHWSPARSRIEQSAGSDIAPQSDSRAMIRHLTMAPDLALVISMRTGRDSVAKLALEKESVTTAAANTAVGVMRRNQSTPVISSTLHPDIQSQGLNFAYPFHAS